MWLKLKESQPDKKRYILAPKNLACWPKSELLGTLWAVEMRVEAIVLTLRAAATAWCLNLLAPTICIFWAWPLLKSLKVCFIRRDLTLCKCLIIHYNNDWRSAAAAHFPTQSI